MVLILTVLTGLSMLATLAMLFAGMIGIVRGDGDPGRSNTLMRWRVICQGVTIVLFIMLLLATRSG